MIRTFFALLLAGCLLATFIYLCSLIPVPSASSAIHQTIDNHTTITITNNMPTDWSGVALLVIAVAVLIYIAWIIVQAFIELRRRNHDRTRGTRKDQGVQ